MEEGSVEPAKPQPSVVTVRGRDEMNFAEFPLALLTDRAPSGLKTIETEDQITDERKGQVLKRKLTITASDKYGLTTPKDEDVLLALIQLTKESNNFTDRKVSFSRSELLKLLGWPRTGASYERITLAFCRWSTVFFLYENSWWENRQQTFTTRGFNIIDNFELNTGRPVAGAQTEFPFSRFSWNEIVFGSFEGGYLKKLDFEFYLRLKHTTSKRMYRFLDKRFHRDKNLTFDLDKFAFEKIGLSRSYTDSGKIKEKLQHAIEELTDAGFLEPMSREERYTKIGPGKWSITIAKRKSRIEPKVRKSQTSPLEQALIERGVTPATAAELCEAFVEEHIQPRLEAFDWLMAKKDRRASKSPGGYLADSIRKGYAVPRGFESKADQAKRLAAEVERQRLAVEVKAQAEAAERAREEADQARISGYWDSLSPGEREALKGEAISNAGPFYIQQYRRNQKDPASAERYLKLIIQIHIAAILDQAKKTEADG